MVQQKKWNLYNQHAFTFSLNMRFTIFVLANCYLLLAWVYTVRTGTYSIMTGNFKSCCKSAISDMVSNLISKNTPTFITFLRSARKDSTKGAFYWNMQKMQYLRTWDNTIISNFFFTHSGEQVEVGSSFEYFTSCILSGHSTVKQGGMWSDFNTVHNGWPHLGERSARR